MKSYKIDCGIHHSVLAARGDVDGHATVQDALIALGRILTDTPFAVSIDDAVLVYSSKEAAEADDEGTDAIATIHTVVDG